MRVVLRVHLGGASHPWGHLWFTCHLLFNGLPGVGYLGLVYFFLLGVFALFGFMDGLWRVFWVKKPILAKSHAFRKVCSHAVQLEEFDFK